MRRHRGGRRADENPSATRREPADPLVRLTAAVNELNGLADIRLPDAIERLLTDLGDVIESSEDKIEAVHRLRIWRADHLALTSELDAATRSLRMNEERLGQRIDVALADWERRFEAVARPAAGTKTPAFRRRWLQGLWRPGNAETIDAESEQTPHGQPGSPREQPDCEADIAVRVLGPMELNVAGDLVPRWNSLKARSIFQYLLVHHDRPVRREVLMELEWPAHSHDSARNNLNVALYTLRNTLDRTGLAVPAILHKEGCYLLNPALTWWIDRSEFLSLIEDARRARQAGSVQRAIDACRSAVKLYRGPLFEDDPSGEWYPPERRQLKELNLQALEFLAQTYCDRDQVSLAVEFGRQAINIDPCYEAVHRLLMRCYARQHQQQLVGRQYQLCVAALRDELDVPPDAETVRLFRSLTSTA